MYPPSGSAGSSGAAAVVPVAVSVSTLTEHESPAAQPTEMALFPLARVAGTSTVPQVSQPPVTGSETCVAAPLTVIVTMRASVCPLL